MNKTQLIEMLEGPASAEFTFMPVSKVIELLKQLEEAPSSQSLVEFLDTFQKKVIDQVVSSINSFDTSEMVDKDSAELSLDYDNRVEIDSIDVDLNSFEDELVSDLEQLFRDTKSELEEVEEVAEQTVVETN